MINQAKDQLLTLYSILFATSLVVANVTATKVVSFGETFVIPAAVVTYAFTFLLTAIIHDVTLPPQRSHHLTPFMDQLIHRWGFL